jgi:hypothetical protein
MNMNTFTVTSVIVVVVSRNSSVGVEIRYGLDDPGIESLWGTRFFSLFQTSRGGQTTLT